MCATCVGSQTVTITIPQAEYSFAVDELKIIQKRHEGKTDCLSKKMLHWGKETFESIEENKACSLKRIESIAQTKIKELKEILRNPLGTSLPSDPVLERDFTMLENPPKHDFAEEMIAWLQKVSRDESEADGKGEKTSLDERGVTVVDGSTDSLRHFMDTLLARRAASERQSKLQCETMSTALSLASMAVADIKKVQLPDPEEEAKKHEEFIEARMESIADIRENTVEGLKEEVDSLKGIFQQDVSAREEAIIAKIKAVKEVATSLAQEITTMQEEHRKVLVAKADDVEKAIRDKDRTVSRLETVLTATSTVTKEAIDSFKDTQRKTISGLQTQLNDCEALVKQFENLLKLEDDDIKEQEKSLKDLRIAYTSAEARVAELRGILASKGGGGGFFSFLGF